MTQNNKQLALDHFNRINAGDLAGAAALLAEDCVMHQALPEAQGRQGFELILGKVRGAFPDMRYTIEDTLADGDRVIVRLGCTGTQRGPLTFARFQMPATGRPVKFEQIHIFRISGGKIVETWMEQDTVAMLRQLGVQLTPSA